MSKKKIPTKVQIDKFMTIMTNKLEHTLLIGSEDPNYEVYAFKSYGNFLALVPENDYEKVAEKIANEIALYNLAMDDKLTDAYDKNKMKESLRWALKLQETLFGIEGNKCNLNEKEFHVFLDSLDKFIKDLKKNENFIAGESQYGFKHFNFMSRSAFGKKAKKTKTPLKTLIKQILKDYKIYGYSKEAKELIDRLNEPPQEYTS